MWTTGDISSFAGLVNLTDLNLCECEKLQGALWRIQMPAILLHDTAEAVTRMYLVERLQVTSALLRD